MEINVIKNRHYIQVEYYAKSKEKTQITWDIMILNCDINGRRTSIITTVVIENISTDDINFPRLFICLFRSGWEASILDYQFSFPFRSGISMDKISLNDR